jgi:Tfp pilus assembly pilus retraction ATPase PilT
VTARKCNARHKGLGDLKTALFAPKTGYLLKTHVHSMYKVCAAFFSKEGLNEMKPENWDSLSSQEKQDVAQELLYSHRGKYIVYRALTLATEALRKIPESLREYDTIEDMEILFELFPKPDFETRGPGET